MLHNSPPALGAAIASHLQFRRRWRGASETERWASDES
jgi:hypothetical protein